MGQSTIPTRSDATTIDATWFNLIKSILNVDLVPRNGSGVATDEAGNLGTASLTWSKIFFGGAANLLSLESSGGNAIFKKLGSTVVVIKDDGITKTSIAPVGAVFSNAINFSTGSSTYVAVTNSSLNITTTGRPVLVMLNPVSGSNSRLFGGLNSFVNALTIEILRDDGTGPVVAATFVLSDTIGSNGAGDNQVLVNSSWPISSVFFFDNDVLGNPDTYTYSLQLKNDSGAATSSGISGAKLLAYEL